MRSFPYPFLPVIFLALFLSGTQLASAGCGTNAIGTARTLTISGSANYGRSHGGRQLALRTKEVVLTFDDGPLAAKTGAILRILRSHCAKATFFPVGKMVAFNPGMIRRIRRGGHTVGSHAMRHINLKKLSYDAAVNQVYKGFAITARAGGGTIAPFFRPPGFNITPEISSLLRRNKISIFGTDIDSTDWKGLKGEEMANHILNHLRNRRQRGIILFHDINRATISSLSLVLKTLKKNGYRVVHIRPGRTIGMTQIRRLKASVPAMMMSRLNKTKTRAIKTRHTRLRTARNHRLSRKTKKYHKKRSRRLARRIRHLNRRKHHRKNKLQKYSRLSRKHALRRRLASRKKRIRISRLRRNRLRKSRRYRRLSQKQRRKYMKRKRHG